VLTWPRWAPLAEPSSAFGPRALPANVDQVTRRLPSPAARLVAPPATPRAGGPPENRGSPGAPAASPAKVLLPLNSESTTSTAGEAGPPLHIAPPAPPGSPTFVPFVAAASPAPAALSSKEERTTVRVPWLRIAPPCDPGLERPRRIVSESSDRDAPWKTSKARSPRRGSITVAPAPRPTTRRALAGPVSRSPDLGALKRGRRPPRSEHCPSLAVTSDVIVTVIRQPAPSWPRRARAACAPDRPAGRAGRPRRVRRPGSGSAARRR
jgi:hypothetical protein